MSTLLDKDLTALKTFLKRWDRFIMEADLERFIGLLTDEALLMPPDHPSWNQTF